jgi:hypothetical protein
LIKIVRSEEPWRLDFCYAKNVKKRSRGLACFSSRTNTREMMSVKDFWSGCVATHVWWLWGSWDDECAVCFILRRELMLHFGSSRDFRNKGILENIIDYIHQSYLESLSSLWEESWEVVELVSMGFLLLGMSCYSHETTYWFLERKSRVKLIPCGP